eukprot:c38977_g1_i1.p2 GENE.c38977_g1_i1~~c38977_g1_i1.p2  ORF type:complete len:145 (+),score=20.21 c38977_g1_i1:56-436(+)
MASADPAPGMVGYFKKSMTEAQRREHAEKLRAKYPERLPIICEKAENSADLNLRKTKFLVPGTMNVGQFLHVVRKHAELTPSTAVYLFCKGVVPPTDMEMRTLYEAHKDVDSFVYLAISQESTFGV